MTKCSLLRTGAFFLLTAVLLIAPASLAFAQDNGALLKTAENHRNNGQINRAYRIALPLAEGGDVEAMAFLASLATYNNPPLKREDAARWIELAAELGHAHSQWQMGTYHKFGRYGFPKDMGKALVWARRSAAQDHTWGHQMILDIGKNRALVPREEVLASLEAIKAVAEGGDFFWMNRLGQNFQEGIGIARDPVAASRWYDRVLASPDAGNTHRFDAHVGKGEVQRSLAKSLPDIENAFDNLLIATSDQFCSVRTSVGGGRMECKSMKPLRETEQFLASKRCDFGFDERRVSDPGLLFRCDLLRAIAYFSERRELVLRADKVAVRAGALLVTTRTDGDWRPAARQRLAVSHPNLTWKEFPQVWNGKKTTSAFTCEMELMAAQALRRTGSAIVRAELRNLNGTEPFFRCSLR
jgi:hypothetical protein